MITVNEGTALILALGSLVTTVMSVLTYVRTQQSARVIEVLEKNTNSIKDALVKVTGEAEHAKGVLAGKEEAAAGAH